MSNSKIFSILCVRLLCSLFILASIPTFTVAQDSVISNLDCSAYPNSVAAVISDPNVCGCKNCECLTCSYCGDGLILLDEECDDGNKILTDNCRADCRLPYCGDGVWTQEIDLPKGETCDYNDPQTKTGCREDCTKCGDNDVNNPLEECDGTDTPAGKTCRNNCKVVVCGDGFLDETNNENCDYGIKVGQASYVPNCRANGFKCTYCGDGEIQAGVEECDLTDLGGVTHPNAKCSNECQIDPYCGDGQLADNEICEGTNFGNYANPNNIPLANLICTGSCNVHVRPYCGDGEAKRAFCVDNFEEDWGYCTDTEECDGEDFSVYFELNPDKADIPQDALTCRDDCTVIVEDYCGDGVVTAGEICDGNDFSGYANPNNIPLNNLTCSASCEVTVKPYCGDGIVNGVSKDDLTCQAIGCPVYEECDGNDFSDDINYPLNVDRTKVTCNDYCRVEFPPYCGDDIRNEGELCDGDDFNLDPGVQSSLANQVCNEECRINPYCGDGILNLELGEKCDLGENNGAPGSRCSLTCEDEPYCGDGIRSEGELCDGDDFDLAEGLQVSTTDQLCNSICEVNLYCGDGIFSPELGELCDLGVKNGTLGSRCSLNCEMTPYCGDGIVNGIPKDQPTCQAIGCPVYEECDGSDFADDLNFPLNVDPTKVTCNEFCRVEFPPYCGDGFRNEGELCDGDDFYLDQGVQISLTNQVCNNECTINPYCGDGILSPELGEKCDLGASNGTPNSRCSVTCEEVPYCGDGIRDENELCDGTDFDLIPGSQASPTKQICNTECEITKYCGDGIVSSELGEKCDLGVNNGVAGSGCSSTCDVVNVCDNVPVPTQVDRGRYRYNDYCDPKKIVCVKGDGVDSAFNFTNYKGIADLFYNNTNLNQGVTRVDVNGNVIVTDANGGQTDYTGTKLSADPNACWTCACNRGSDGCFPPGTKVTLANNQEVLVENVKVGDYLLGAPGQKLEVLKVVEGPETEALVQLTYGVEKIKISQKHVVLTKAGLKRAIEVKPGDEVKKADGTWIAVSSQELLPVVVGQNVINFTLSEISVSEVDNHLLVSEGIYTGDLVLQTEFDQIKSD